MKSVLPAVPDSPACQDGLSHGPVGPARGSLVGAVEGRHDWRARGRPRLRSSVNIALAGKRCQEARHRPRVRRAFRTASVEGTR